jgi:hypothetical protein
MEKEPDPKEPNHYLFAYNAGETAFVYGNFDDARKRLEPIYRSQCGTTPFAFKAWKKLVTIAALERDFERSKKLAEENRNKSCALSDADRADRIKGLAEGRYQVLASCDLISEGTDIPVVTAAIMLRPTQSLVLFLQQGGRVLRPFQGKANSIIIDAVGNTVGPRGHGLLEEPREWSLDGAKKRKKNTALMTGPRYLSCSKCYGVFAPAPKCPFCGTVRELKDRSPEQVAGVLEQLKVDHEALAAMRLKKQEQGRAQSLGDLIRVGKARGMKNPVAWAHHVFNARQAKRSA